MNGSSHTNTLTTSFIGNIGVLDETMRWKDISEGDSINISVVKGDYCSPHIDASPHKGIDKTEHGLQISNSSSSSQVDEVIVRQTDIKKKFHVYIRDYESTDEPESISARSSMDGEELICKVFGQPDDEFTLKTIDNHIIRSNQPLKAQGIQDGAILEGIQ